MDALREVRLDDAAGALEEFGRSRWSAGPTGSCVKVAKGTGATTWHAHDDQEEVFLVLSGTLRVELRGEDVTLGPGELLVVPRGVEHRPVADGVVHLLLIGTDVTSTAAVASRSGAARRRRPA